MSEERVVKVVSELPFPQLKRNEFREFPDHPPTDQENQTCPVCNNIFSKQEFENHLKDCFGD